MSNRPEIFQAYEMRLDEGREIVHRAPVPETDGRPLVTIIIVVLNNRRTIGRALDSIIQQSYPFIETVVVDGGSTDGTFELLWERRNEISLLIRGPDKSPADAVNKGIIACRGEMLSLLPSDDYLEPDYVAHAVSAFERLGSDFVFGDIIFLREGLPPLRIPGDPNYRDVLHHTMPQVNPVTMMFRRRCFEAVGLWDSTERICPDYDLLLRLDRDGFRGSYDSRLVTNFSFGGISSQNYIATFARVRAVALAHGGPLWAVNWSFCRAVLRRMGRDILMRILPASLFYEIQRRMTRTGMHLEPEA